MIASKSRLLSRAQIKRICRNLGGYPKSADAIGVNASTNASKTAMMSRWARTGLPPDLEIRLAEMDPAYNQAAGSVLRAMRRLIEDAEGRPLEVEHLEKFQEAISEMLANWNDGL